MAKADEKNQAAQDEHKAKMERLKASVDRRIEAAQEEKALAQTENYEITLDEFCARLSVTDKRVEMIGGFHSDMTRVKKTKGMEADYRAEYQKFITRPA